MRILNHLMGNWTPKIAHCGVSGLYKTKKVGDKKKPTVQVLLLILPLLSFHTHTPNSNLYCFGFYKMVKESNSYKIYKSYLHHEN